MDRKRILTAMVSANLTLAALLTGCGASSMQPPAEPSAIPTPTPVPVPAPTPAQPSVTLTFDAAQPGASIPNLVSDVNMWDYHGDWLELAEAHPDDHFSKTMPFIRYVHFMTATGGEPARDLFRNPGDRSVLDDYDFSSLIRACRNVLKKGLKPYIKTGNVPEKFTSRPVTGGFGVNTMPPDDFEQYYQYMTALFQALKEEFGPEELLSWKWGVLTEYENGDWFSIPDDPEGTKLAYFKLYDYTVDALQQVVGENVYVGAHSMTVIGGFWDECEFIEHCATGTNLKTGKTGTRLKFLAASYYDYTPADRAGETGQGLAGTIRVLQEKAKAAGLNDLEYGIDEGRILSGSDDKPLYPRTIGQTMQASWDAKLFRIMLDNNIGYFSSWGYTTDGIWDGIPSVSMHVANLFWKMVGQRRIPLAARDGIPAFGRNDITGFASVEEDGRRVSVLAYAYTYESGFDGSESVRVRVNGAAGLGARAKVTMWIVGDDSNFFDEWIADRTEHGITDDSFDWSRDSFVLTNPAVLKSDTDRMFFKSQEEKYRKCAQLNSTEQLVDVADGAVDVDVTIPHHGVVLIELIPAQ